MKQIFQISANLKSDKPPYFTTMLPVGTWSICAISSDESDFLAWNAWAGQVADCTTPCTCARGWLNNYNIWSPGFTSLPNNMMSVGNGRYDSPQLAVQSAKPEIFTIQGQPSIVTFFILDSYHDNIGGLTLQLTKVSSAV